MHMKNSVAPFVCSVCGRLVGGILIIKPTRCTNFSNLFLD